MKITSAILLLCLLCACAGAGKVDYSPPSSRLEKPQNSTVVPRSRDAIWQAAIPELGKRFFVINNLDKSSGLINVSYSGDPEKYIDCGRITSYVKNARGERRYEFAASKAQQTYELLEPAYGHFLVDRRMDLEGRINIVFEELSPGITQVSANIRYIVNRNQVVRNTVNKFPQTTSDAISFNSNAKASFPANLNGRATTCVATGVLESEILSVVK